MLIGNRGDRMAGLPQVQRAAADLGEATAPLLCWLEGHDCANAEPLWREAHAGFTDLGDELWAGFIVKPRASPDLPLGLAQAPHRHADFPLAWRRKFPFSADFPALAGPST